MDQPNRKLLVLGVVLVMIMIGFIVFLGLKSRREQVAPIHKTEFIGFSEISENGGSSFHPEVLEIGINDYLKKSGRKVSRVEVKSGTAKIKPRPRLSEATDELYFVLVLDGKAQNARMEILGLTSLRLYIYAPNSTNLVFDSGKIVRPVEVPH